MRNGILIAMAAALTGPLLAAGVTPVAARNHSAPAYDGPARVIDGDTIVIDGRHIRLFGIDAMESRQLCDDGWDGGVQARAHLIELINRADVHCEETETDKYGRSVAMCRQGAVDLN